MHLGTRGCQADKLLDFLRHHEADTIYLVGDIVDGWALRSSWYWPQAHNDVVQKLLRKARKGARVIYIPGNHDEFLRGYYGTHFGGIEVVENTIHEGADGRRYLVVHGDIFDLVVTQARWLALLGDKAYDFALTANRVFNGLRRVFGAPYWSLSKWAKLKVKNAVNYIGAFEKALATEAKHHQADGVICGHIHTAAIHDDFGLRYINCGDWVESCTAVAEHHDGRFEIITWTAPATTSSRRRPTRRRTACSRPLHDPEKWEPAFGSDHAAGECMKILVATDAWHPQVNGVVRTLGHVAREARALGAEIEFLTPGEFWTLPMPSYPEVRLALTGAGRRRAQARARASPTPFTSRPKARSAMRMRRVCMRRGLPFTTSFHTRFPDYVADRLPLPERWTCAADLGLAAPLP